jgi:RHS repeat-associated protein
MRSRLGYMIYRLFLVVATAFAFLLRTSAQTDAFDVNVPVSFWAEAKANAWPNTISVMLAGGNSTAGNFTATGIFSTPSAFANMVVGKRYDLAVSWSQCANALVTISPPPGFQVLINGRSNPTYAVSAPFTGVSVVIWPEGEIGGPAGMAGPPQTQNVIWTTDIGYTSDGRAGGVISIRKSAIDSQLFTRACLNYVGESSTEIEAVYDTGGSLRQVKTASLLVDLVDITQGYELRFYSAGNYGTSKVSGVYPVNGGAVAFVIHRIDNAAVSPALVARFTKLYPGPLTAEKTEITHSATVWERKRFDGAVAASTETITEISASPKIYETVVKDSANVQSARYQAEFQTLSLGGVNYQVVKKITAMPGSQEKIAISEYNAYNASYPGSSYRKSSTTSADGNWTKFIYNESGNQKGLVSIIAEPFKDSPTAPSGYTANSGVETSFTYHIDQIFPVEARSLLRRRPLWMTRKINGQTIALVQHYYTFGSLNSLSTILDYRYDYHGLGGNDYVWNPVTSETYSQLLSGASQEYLRGRPASVIESTLRKTVFAYHKGDWNSTTKAFTPGSSGNFFRTVALIGSAHNAVGRYVNAFGSGVNPAISPLYLWDRQSIATVDIRDITGNVIRSETWVFRKPAGGGNPSVVNIGAGADDFEITGWTENTYDPEGHRVTSVNSSTEAVSAGYVKGRKNFEVDKTGVRMEYVSDDLGRVTQITKVGVVATPPYASQADIVTQNSYDASGRVTNTVINPSNPVTVSTIYNLAGDVVESKDEKGVIRKSSLEKEGANTHFSRIREQVVQRAGGVDTLVSEMLTSKFRDRTVRETLVPVTGIPNGYLMTYDYGVFVDSGTGKPYLKTTSYQGTSSSVRKTEDLTDMIGRKFSISSGQTLNTYNIYNGLVDTSASGGTAVTYYKYDWMGNKTSEGLDLNGTADLQASSIDRIRDFDVRYIKDGAGNWWLQEQVLGYPDDNSTKRIILSRQRRRLTGYSGGSSVVSETRTWGPGAFPGSLDAEANGPSVETTERVFSGTADKRREIWTQSTGVANSAKSIYVNGLEVAAVDVAGVRVEKSYDAVGRPSSTTTITGNASATDGPVSMSETVTYVSGTTLVETKTSTSASGSAATTALSYYPNGLLKSSRSPDMRWTYFEYNEAGQELLRWGDGTRPTRTEYDEFGDVVKTHAYRSLSGASASTRPAGFSNSSTQARTGPAWNVLSTSGADSSQYLTATGWIRVPYMATPINPPNVNVSYLSKKITHIGRWVHPGSSGTHTLRLVNSSGVVPGSTVTVTLTAADVGTFKYAALPAPVIINSLSYPLAIESSEEKDGDPFYCKAILDIPGDYQPIYPGTSSSYSYGQGANPGSGSYTQVADDTVLGPLGVLVETPTPSFSGYGTQNYGPVPQSLSGNVRNNFSGWVGTVLQVGAEPMVVTELGRYVRSGNSGSHVVKLVYGGTGKDVPGGSVTVNTAGATVGQTKYVALAQPVTLEAGCIYYLVSQEANAGDTWHDFDTTLTAAPGITPISSVWAYPDQIYSVYGNAQIGYGPLSLRSAPQITDDVTVYQRDPATGLVTKTTDPSGRFETISYDSQGRESVRNSANFKERTTTYDQKTGEVLSVEYLVFGDTTPDVYYTYNRLGNIKTIADALGTRTFRYRESSDYQADLETLPAGFYGANTKVQTKFDTTTALPSGYIAGEAVTPPTWTQTYQDVTTTRSPADGRLATQSASLRNGAFSHQYGFAYLGATDRLLSHTHTHNSIATTYRRTFNQFQPVLKTYSVERGATVYSKYELYYDNQNRIVDEMKTGLLFSKYGNGTGVFTDYLYDARGQLTLATSSINTASVTLSDRLFKAQYDQAGSMSVERRFADTMQYEEITERNSLNQPLARNLRGKTHVTGVAAAGTVSVVAGASYTAMRPGNGSYFDAEIASGGSTSVQQATVSRPSQAPYNVGYLQSNVEGYVYDADGNLRKDSAYIYSYDSENRLVRLEQIFADPDGTRTAKAFRYDYRGRRVQEQTETYSGTAWTINNVRRTLYVGDRPVVLFNKNDSTLTAVQTYVWGPDLSTASGNAGGIGGLLTVDIAYEGALASLTAVNKEYSPVFDNRGNVLGILDAGVNDTTTPANNISAYAEYAPYGEITVSGGLLGRMPFRFQTKWSLDAEWSGKLPPQIYDFGFRMYSTRQGRFISRDPLGPVSDINLYRYCNGDPINHVDPDGRQYQGLNVLDRAVITAPLIDWAQINSHFDYLHRIADISRPVVVGGYGFTISYGSPAGNGNGVNSTWGTVAAGASPLSKVSNGVLFYLRVNQTLSGQPRALAAARNAAVLDFFTGNTQLLLALALYNPRFSALALYNPNFRHAADPFLALRLSHELMSPITGGISDAFDRYTSSFSNAEGNIYALGSAGGEFGLNAAGLLAPVLGQGNLFRVSFGSLGNVTRSAEVTIARTAGAGLTENGIVAAESGVWSMKPFARGSAIEEALGANLPKNFPTIDRFSNGVATSIKSIDLGAASYQNPANLTRLVNGYVDQVAAFNGRTWAGAAVDSSQITARQLQIAVPGAGSAAQQAALSAAAQRAQSVGVQLIVTPFP